MTVNKSVINDSNGDESESALVLTTEEAIFDMGGSKVSQKIHEDVSLSVSDTSNVDLPSPDAGMTSHACHGKLKDRGTWKNLVLI